MGRFHRAGQGRRGRQRSRACADGVAAGGARAAGGAAGESRRRAPSLPRPGPAPARTRHVAARSDASALLHVAGPDLDAHGHLRAGVCGRLGVRRSGKTAARALQDKHSGRLRPARP